MVTNLSLNDSTQREILKHLEITSKLLDKATTRLSGRRKECNIYAMPDLGIAQNGTRMLGGFYTGACYIWDSDIPFIPVDATVNVCGTAVYRLKEKITVEEFKKRLDKTMKDRSIYIKYAKTCLPKHILGSINLERTDEFYWNYNVGNHFVILAEQKDRNSKIPVGQYMIVHASAIELKKDNLKFGLYPVEGNWFYDDIQTVYDDENRYLRYIQGEKASQFYEIASKLKLINEDRNRYFCKEVLGELVGEEVINSSHYGMPNGNTVCIGCQWELNEYTLLTSPGNNIYLVKPKENAMNSINIGDKSIILTPHGCGTMFKRAYDKIKYLNERLIIGSKQFEKGQNINIGEDVLIRTSNMNKENLEQYIKKVLRRCPGIIYGTMHQLFARTKYGDFNYVTKEEAR